MCEDNRLSTPITRITTQSDLQTYLPCSYVTLTPSDFSVSLSIYYACALSFLRRSSLNRTHAICCLPIPLPVGLSIICIPSAKCAPVASALYGPAPAGIEFEPLVGG